jgi:3-dehydroquinate dehydratase/shikimate dehydrogenase
MKSTQIIGITTTGIVPRDLPIDLLEIRVDLCSPPVNESYSYPILATLRTKNQGGAFIGSTDEYLHLIQKLASQGPDWLDVETTISPLDFNRLRQNNPPVKLICSHHDTSGTPDDESLERLWIDMQQRDADSYKIVCTAHNALDAMRLLRFAKGKRNLTAFCMGVEGTFSRILSPIIGAPFIYAPLDSLCAPGQIPLEEMLERYRIDQLSSQTKILGLIGNPVDRSPSRWTHHKAISHLNIDAVYVRIAVDPGEVATFLKLAHELGFHGLSVTMPHKESIPSAENRAVNTLKFESNGIECLNTDGMGACDAVESKLPLLGAHVVILGAGGAAIGIAKEALRRGATVTLLNRTLERAERAAKILGCSCGQLDDFATVAKEGYDILINTIPGGICSVDSEALLPGKVCLEVVSRPFITPFLLACRAKDCTTLPGITMFLGQAKEQFKWWFPQTESDKILDEAFSSPFHTDLEVLCKS